MLSTSVCPELSSEAGPLACLGAAAQGGGSVAWSRGPCTGRRLCRCFCCHRGWHLSPRGWHLSPGPRLVGWPCRRGPRRRGPRSSRHNWVPPALSAFPDTVGLTVTCVALAPAHRRRRGARRRVLGSQSHAEGPDASLGGCAWGWIPPLRGLPRGFRSSCMPPQGRVFSTAWEV